MPAPLIITDEATAREVFGALDRYHRETRRIPSMPKPMPETHVAAWSLARDVTPPTGAGSAPQGGA